MVRTVALYVGTIVLIFGLTMIHPGAGVAALGGTLIFVSAYTPPGDN